MSKRGRKPAHNAWKNCTHVIGFGQMAVDVDLECPLGRNIKGRRLCLKENCDSACLHWEEKT